MSDAAENSRTFLDALESAGFNYFSGVPCSLLKGIIRVFDEEPRWGSAFRLAGEMFEESGVRLRFMERLAELPRGEWPLNPKDLSDD